MDDSPIRAPRVSRRSGLKRLAVGGAIASAGPALLSTPAQAQTPSCTAFLRLETDIVIPPSIEAGERLLVPMNVAYSGGTFPFAANAPTADGAYAVSFMVLLDPFDTTLAGFVGPTIQGFGTTWSRSSFETPTTDFLTISRTNVIELQAGWAVGIEVEVTAGSADLRNALLSIDLVNKY